MCLLRKCMRYPQTLGLMMKFEINLIFVICKNKKFSNKSCAESYVEDFDRTNWPVDLLRVFVLPTGHLLLLAHYRHILLHNR